MAEIENQNSLQEQYMKNLVTLEEGSLIEGKVISVTEDTVMIDIGYKSDGSIPTNEFEVPPKVGEIIKIKLIKLEGRNGNVQVSKKAADEVGFKDVLNSAVKDKIPVKGKITKSIKGGYEVDLGSGYTAFLPLSKTDVSRVEDPEDFIGLESEFLVEKLEHGKKTNIVLNRRDYIMEIVTKKRDEFFEKAQIGDEVEGVVKSFTSFGAFVDLGGFDGLLHINDMSWGHVTRPKDYVKKGDKIKLKVIRLEQDEKRINLSLKHFVEDPWNHFEDKYAKGTVVNGKVTKLTDFGVFIEIEEGIEGLAHISELSWVKRVTHPKEIFKIGDPVEAKILDYDVQQGRISLGLKQVTENPWDSIIEKYPVGKVLNLEVKKVTSAGAFLTLEEGIDGFLHADDLSWTKKVKNIGSEVKEGETIEVKVIGIDPEARRIRLGVKQVGDDPWAALKTGYPRGSIINGTVTNKTDFGVFVKVPGDIEGLIAKSQLCDSRDEDPEEFLKKINIGDPVKAVVIDVSPEKQKLALSLRDYVKQVEKAEISRYIHKDEDEPGFTLGDAFKK